MILLEKLNLPVMKKIIFALFAICFFAGCGKEKCEYNPCSIVAPEPEIQQVRSYLSANGLNATQHCSGLFYIIDSPGSGKAPDACSNVAVTYEGKLTDGSVFDSATSPVPFNLSSLITGFKNGIPFIKEGGRIRLFVPPSLGYGSRAAGSIPANSVLIFDVTLVSIPR
jgi:FKBP-type peptidyl-prolyl cis-trans isomerase FkpA